MELQKYLPKFLISRRKKALSAEDCEFSGDIAKIIGYQIRNLACYREAFTLKSSSSAKNFERLEYLGDAVLGAIISSYLYSEYPDRNEGYLTQMKSKIVNRKNLNQIGEKLGLLHFVKNHQNLSLSENIYGNLFEAFVGAIFIDFDYDICRDIVLEKLLTKADILKLENKIISYKGVLLEWAQKKKVKLEYQTTEEILGDKSVRFRSVICINGEKTSSAGEISKKKAEEKAAQRAIYILNNKEKIIESHQPFAGQ